MLQQVILLRKPLQTMTAFERPQLQVTIQMGAEQILAGKHFVALFTGEADVFDDADEVDFLVSRQI